MRCQSKVRVVKLLARALVVYYSKFGNTEKIARALAGGLQSGGIDTDIVKVDEVKYDELDRIDLLCVGTPVHAWNISKPAKDFLERLKGLEGLSGKKAFAFDTKFKSRLAGSAGGKVEKKLKSLGFAIEKSARSAIVLGNEGPLEEGAEGTFKQIGEELASMI